MCLASNYSTERVLVNRKWWHKAYWGIFDGLLANVFTLYKMAHPDENRCDKYLENMDAVCNFNHPHDEGPSKVN
eukprot:jgi/Mesen1/2481/ME000159S01606